MAGTPGARPVGNILWNFAGVVLPLAAGLAAFPLLLRGFGAERFGVLSIAWLLVGYFGLFDMGLSRALTKFVAERREAGRQAEAAAAAATALALLWGLGLLSAAALWLLAPWLAGKVLVISAGFRDEASSAFRILALSLPIVVHTAGLRGLIEAHHDFRVAGILRLLLGVATFVAPVLVLPADGDLADAMWLLLGLRVCLWLAHRHYARARMPEAFARAADRRWLRPLLGLGGWMSVSNVIGPLMVYLDRFLIGALLSVTAVTYYTVSYEVVTRMTLVATAIAGVFFPLFAAQWRSQPAQAARLLGRGLTYAYIVLAPVLAALSWLAPEILGLWLGAEYAVQGSRALQWLAAGALMNGMAQIAFALVQGAGRADWTAKLHLAEALPYWLALYWLLGRHGIEGAAIAWCLRASIDAWALFWCAGRLDPAFGAAIRLPARQAAGVAGVILLPLLFGAPALRAALLALGAAGFAWYAWSRLATADERAWLAALLRRKL